MLYSIIEITIANQNRVYDNCSINGFSRRKSTVMFSLFKYIYITPVDQNLCVNGTLKVHFSFFPICFLSIRNKLLENQVSTILILCKQDFCLTDFSNLFITLKVFVETLNLYYMFVTYSAKIKKKKIDNFGFCEV